MKKPTIVFYGLSWLITLGVLSGFVWLSYSHLFDYAKTIEVKEIRGQLGVLINLSAILFGIVGAWMAIAFPPALKKVMNPEKFELGYSGVDEDILKSLLKVLVFSAGTLMLVLLIDLVLSTINSNLLNGLTFGKDSIKATCALIVWFLYLVQIKSFLIIILSTVRILFELVVRKTTVLLDTLTKRQK